MHGAALRVRRDVDVIVAAVAPELVVAQAGADRVATTGRVGDAKRGAALEGRQLRPVDDHQAAGLPRPVGREVEPAVTGDLVVGIAHGDRVLAKASGDERARAARHVRGRDRVVAGAAVDVVRALPTLDGVVAIAAKDDRGRSERQVLGGLVLTRQPCAVLLLGANFGSTAPWNTTVRLPA